MLRTQPVHQSKPETTSLLSQTSRSMSSSREVVITGVGVVSPIGNGYEPFWDSLIQGKSGVKVQERFAETDWPYRIAAPINDFDPKQYVKPRKALKIMCAPIQYGCAAAAMAALHANLDREATSPDRTGTVFGTETFFADPNEVADVFRKCTVDRDYQHDHWGVNAMREIQPLWMLKYLPNMASSHISIAFDARGPSNSICQGEASGLLALIEAANLIQRGTVDVVVAGGTGSQMELTAMLYRGTHLLSNRIFEPEQASRPFDSDRDGMVVGAGAGALILESAEHARARGAEPLATIAGWSRTYQNPSSEQFGAALAGGFQAALTHAEFDASDIGLVNANASGSVHNDPIEATAIEQVFGDCPVVAHKSNFGNLGPGTSSIELIGAVLALKNSLIPPSLNCDHVDPACPVNVITSPTPLGSRGVIKSSFSSTGQICSVILTR